MKQREQAIYDLLTAAGLNVVAGSPDKMALQAIQTWCPQPTVQRTLDRQYELMLTIMLHGDRAANHLFYWNDGAGAEWTPNVGLYTQVYYGLPTDENGLLLADGLATAVRDGAAIERPTFLEILRSNPAQTLIDNSSSMTALDLQMPQLAADESLQSWAAVKKSGPDVTRWRQIQSVVEKRRIPAAEWK